MALTFMHCSLCGESIEEKAHKLDPCGLYIISNIMEEEDKQNENLFFCHYECFRMAMDAGTRVHLNLEDQVIKKSYFRSNQE